MSARLQIDYGPATELRRYHEDGLVHRYRRAELATPACAVLTPVCADKEWRYTIEHERYRLSFLRLHTDRCPGCVSWESQPVPVQRTPGRQVVWLGHSGTLPRALVGAV
ncbi:hypothetical protein [Amycolatopsis thermophila]|uniref:Zinc-finger of transposase IS204/IS1001/IS1096/IS1165 n=1 Tax=Amycolatopsis thermophila TaxID=206084 RepID=A0ABU0EMF7_9PSEU|nr:hypothetical protein [Amycolatopsis thermophila]MDQ0376470.1 hypothetical protein [Amycolatopsis thermophila]